MNIYSENSFERGGLIERVHLLRFSRTETIFVILVARGLTAGLERDGGSRTRTETVGEEPGQRSKAGLFCRGSIFSETGNTAARVLVRTDESRLIARIEHVEEGDTVRRVDPRIPRHTGGNREICRSESA